MHGNAVIPANNKLRCAVYFDAAQRTRRFIVTAQSACRRRRRCRRGRHRCRGGGGGRRRRHAIGGDTRHRLLEEAAADSGSDQHPAKLFACRLLCRQSAGRFGRVPHLTSVKNEQDIGHQAAAPSNTASHTPSAIVILYIIFGTRSHEHITCMYKVRNA